MKLNRQPNRRQKKSRSNEWIGLVIGIALALALTFGLIKLFSSGGKSGDGAATTAVLTTADSASGDKKSTAEPGGTTDAPQSESADDGEDIELTVNIDGFSEADNRFLSGTVFVGDSICSGVSVYGYIPEDQVLATESVSAHTINSYTFPVDGAEYDYAEALKKLQPKTVVFFMGMNDTYLSVDAYCNNYADILRTAHSAVPGAKLYVASITPVAASCTYTTNANIDSFNQAIRTRVASAGFGYVDISTSLKGADNCLMPDYAGPDGIHLPTAAYRIILEDICNQLAK